MANSSTEARARLDQDASSEERFSEHKDELRNNSTARSSRKSSISAAERARRNLNAKLANPLAGYSIGELREMGAEYAENHALGDSEDTRAFELGAILAQEPQKFERLAEHGASDEEMEVLRKEFKSKWSQPKLLYLVIVLSSTCAAVQGMDETVVNGGQIFFAPQFGIGGDDLARHGY